MIIISGLVGTLTLSLGALFSQVDTNPVGEKDVVLALIATSAALVGLVLVFLGFIVATFESYDTEAKTSVRKVFRLQARWTMGGFAVGLASVTTATFWLLHPQDILFKATVALFAGQLVLLAISAFVVTRDLVWK